MIKILSNQDEQGVESDSSVAGSAARAVKGVVKSAVSQFDIVSYLYGMPNQQAEQENPNQDPAITEALRPYQGKANASLKARVNLRNPIVAQAMVQRRQQLLKRKAPEKADELERLRLLLHEEQVRDIMQPSSGQPEEPIAEKIARKEEEKKAKKQEKKVEEVKKKEDLKVVLEKTKVEREKGWGAG